MKISTYIAIDKFIKQYKAERYVPDSIAVIVLLATNPELEETIIKKYFTNGEQRKRITKYVKKLKKLVKSNSISSLLLQFVKELRGTYVW